jgi:RNA polymerase sigma factor (sigma-70 family)
MPQYQGEASESEEWRTMARGLSTETLEGLNEVFSKGTLAGLSEAQLLHRYLSARDEGAFAALVGRHGPMVLGICRRVLRDPHDVDDAFQATFLVLVRKAATLRDPRRLSPWLHGVALRVATRARAVARLRQSREPVNPGLDPPDRASERDHASAELRPVFDEELSRLPEKYRNPIVMCYLEGRTHDEAASALGWPVGTVRSRLARARERLKSRLSRRGLAPAVALLEHADWPSLPVPEVPSGLIRSVVEMATRTSLAKSMTAAASSGAVAALAEGVIHAMWMSQLKIVAAVALAAAAIGTGGVVLAQARPVAPGAKGYLDTLVQRAEAPSAPERAVTAAAPPSTDPTSAPGATTRTSPRELQIRLEMAQQKFARLETMFQRGVVGQESLMEARSEVEIIKAQIADAREALEEELELLESRLFAKRAEIAAAEFHVKQASAQLSRMERLEKGRNIASADREASEADVGIAQAHRDQLMAELKAIEIRMKYIKRRHSATGAEPKMPPPTRGANDPAAPNADKGVPNAPTDPGEVRPNERRRLR